MRFIATKSYYYIADVNIESVFHDLTHRKEYLPYDGICLTDTFQLNEDGDRDIFSQLFKENSERVIRQKKAPVRVILGNPPYSVGQKSANDNAQNLSYPMLESRIEETYARNSSANLAKALYDSYVKAFRWASDRISRCDEGGIVAFISNGAWIDGNAQEGVRRCFEKEFSSVWVFNLRGNQRTSGELSRKEGGKIFGSGSRTPIAITILVKNPAKMKGKAEIHYHDIGDYLTREQKLNIISDFKSVASRKMEWQSIVPNKKGDWINQRGDEFDALVPLAPEKKFDIKAQSVFNTYIIGVATNRDVWVSGFSKEKVENNMKSLIDFYNSQIGKSQVSRDDTKISWTVNLLKDVANGKVHHFVKSAFVESLYRPFEKVNLLYDKSFIERPGLWKRLFPSCEYENLVICLKGVGDKDFSVIITDTIPDLQLIFNGQCFPLYWYEENKNPQGSLFDDVDDSKYIRRDGISDWMLQELRARYGNTKSLTKEHIFYYVYGFLHSEQYRTKFAAELKKSLPRISFPDKVEDFLKFYNAGKKLAELHLHYEDVPAYPDVCIEADEEEGDSFDFYSVQKMRFPSKTQKDTIIYNGHIRISGIPEKAYGYVVNGKSAIEWIMERYQMTIDDGKNGSMIKNDPNAWSREHNKPRYILDLLLSVINVSVKTIDIVNSLPEINI